MIEAGRAKAHPRRSYAVCGERSALPARLVVAATSLGPLDGVGVGDVEADLFCLLEEHGTGAHWALVMDLDGPDSGAAWTPWIPGSSPSGVVVLPDCEAVCPDTREPCCEFAAHPGAHSWRLFDWLASLPGVPPDDKAEALAGRKRARHRIRPRLLNQEPEAVTWARQRAGLTKRALAEVVGISEQLMGEIESGWRSATPANLVKIAVALNCPVASLERKRPWASTR